MRKHVVFAAFAIVSALALPHQAEARLHKPAPDLAARNGSGGIIVCDRQGCRPETPPPAASRAGRRERNALRRHGRVGSAPKAYPEPSLRVSDLGIVRSRKTGATARVAVRYAPRFQAYVDDLEAHGAAVYYMGGIRPGRCSPASQHPCGKALDVCQDSRGHVSGARDCHLPRPAEMASIARAHGLHEGAVWCGSPDYGHAQVDPTGTTCAARGTWGHGRPHRRYFATITGKMVAR